MKTASILFSYRTHLNFEPMLKFCTAFFLLGLLFFQSSTAQDGLRTKIISNNFDFVLTDRGSGANSDLTIFKPREELLNDWFYLGHVAVNGYPPQPNSGVYLVQPYGTPDDPSQPPLKKPNGFEKVYSDYGSNANQNISIWRPIAPEGYIAIGCVATTSYESPHPSQFIGLRVVREDLVEQSDDAQLIWNDMGSGADGNVSLWSIKNSKKQDYGYFMASYNYEKPWMTFQLQDTE